MHHGPVVHHHVDGKPLSPGGAIAVAVIVVLLIVFVAIGSATGMINLDSDKSYSSTTYSSPGYSSTSYSSGYTRPSYSKTTTTVPQSRTDIFSGPTYGTHQTQTTKDTVLGQTDTIVTRPDGSRYLDRATTKQRQRTTVTHRRLAEAGLIQADF